MSKTDISKQQPAHFAALGATKEAAKELAAVGPFRIRGRGLYDCYGEEVAYIRRESAGLNTISPHAFDVLCKHLNAALEAFNGGE